MTEVQANPMDMEVQIPIYSFQAAALVVLQQLTVNHIHNSHAATLHHEYGYQITPRHWALPQQTLLSLWS